MGQWDWLADHGLREAARAAASGPLDEEKVLVHGGYRHFNVLWCEGRLTDAKTDDDYPVTYERVAGGVVDRRADLRALLCFDLEWQSFIPRHVAGRAPDDTAGMPERVAVAIRHAVDRID